MMEGLQVVTSHGRRLAATRFIPHRPNGRVVLINPAVGVKQKFYATFANYLSLQGFVVYTYDYSGIGQSRPAKLKNLSVSMADWALDYKAMLVNLNESHPHHKIIVIGHSFGGQVVGFSEWSARIETFVAIASQTPYWKNFHGLFNRAKLFTFWYFLIPVFTRLVGYFPARKFGLFEDIPAKAALQWARWAKTPGYVFDELPALKKNFESLQQPALFIGFRDDELAPEPAMVDLIRYFTQARVTRWMFSPDEILQKRIGHFGFFHKKMENLLWPEVVTWLMKSTTLGKTRAA